HDDGNFGVVLAEPIEEFDAIHFRHDHVAEDEIRRDALDLILGRSTIADRCAVIALGFEHGRNDFTNRFLVVDDEYVFQVHDNWLPSSHYKGRHSGIGASLLSQKTAC